MGLLERWRHRASPATSKEASAERRHLGEWADVSMEDLSSMADAIERIYAGTLDGLCIRGVFSAKELANGVAEIRGDSDRLVDHGTAVMFGTALVGAADDRSDYYAAAPGTQERLTALFGADLFDRFEQVLSTCAGGRPAIVPSEGEGRRYTPATLRILPPDRGVMHGHTANEFCKVWDSHVHLREIARMWDSLSYFVVGQSPEMGGDLVLYDLMWDDTPEEILALPMSEERDQLLADYDVVRVKLAPGDMVLFTGGRIWHRVEPVQGVTERVTIGGFVAMATDESCVYYWS